MKALICHLCITLCLCLPAAAQDSVQYRILLIGDAGKKTMAQQAVIKDAIANRLPGKTIALFLGDNIYPRGMSLTGSKSEVVTREILTSQLEGLRAAGVPVYFIPGNHDWDKSGPEGYKKMQQLNQWVKGLGDSLVQVIPEDVCPGPTELVVNDQLVVVAIDSEWWLYPFVSQPPGLDDCECKSKREVLGKLNDILLRHRNKVVVFATHHPFLTYGVHGGHYNIIDHLFPLTHLNEQLYLPLPGLGSLYPILRRTLPPAEDVRNVLYRDMKKNVEDVLKTHPNVLHVSGHEHSLQLIQGALLQVVSGSGAKNTFVKIGKGSLFASGTSGYVVADLLTDNTFRLRFQTLQQDTLTTQFVYYKKTVPVVPTPGPVQAIVTGDSINIRLNADVNKVSKIHRSLFGENYRQIWAMETTIPVLRLSETGLLPTATGGGMQTRSLRLQDGEKEWVLRSVEKYPDNLLPQSLTNTLAASIIRDNMTAAFPYAPLTVPVFASAVGVPHSNPSIVYIAPDKKLGIYAKDFSNTIALLEEREPAGKSVSTIKLAEKLKDDNDNSVDQPAYLSARLLDIFLGDWDRHADQWRWVATGDGKGKKYRPVPRDRDQVYYTNQGLFPAIAALPWVMPKFQGFGAQIKNINTFSFNARLIDGILTNQLSYADWEFITTKTLAALSDTVIEAAMKKLPAPVYNVMQPILTPQLQLRRAQLLLKMPGYYRFLNKVIDITTSDKNELVLIRDTMDRKLGIYIYKLSKNKMVEQLLYSRVLVPGETRELRLFLMGGEDQVAISNQHSSTRIRIVGDGRSPKTYSVEGSSKALRNVHIYDGLHNATFNGDSSRVRRHLSDNPANTTVDITNRFNKNIPLLIAGFNMDDGLIIGGGLKLIRQGFRKQPYASMQQFTLARSFSSGAFRFNYRGEWLNALERADFLLLANIFAPNTQNFFGRGNATGINKTNNYLSYYRTRFSLYNLAPAMRWRSGKANSISLSPALQYYRYDADDNTGRLISNAGLIHSYDSATIANEKVHAGLVMNIVTDSRNHPLLPSFGAYFNIRVQGFAGLNDYSRSFGQVTGELAVYKSLDRKSHFVIANRVGGGITAGHSAFYQSLFLGGQDNLWGYHQFRFAGEHVFYNNLEARIKLASLASYILPGELGLLAFYDVGKVWQTGFNNDRWHRGGGGGFYFAPAGVILFQLVVGKSVEGWYPYFTMGFRF